MSAPAHHGDPAPRVAAADTQESLDKTLYTMWSVFAVSELLGEERSHFSAEVEVLLHELAGGGLVVRGIYDLAGMRAGADFMIWWHAASIERLQEAYRRLRRTRLGRHLQPIWSSAGLHRPAEFNRAHLPAFMTGEEPRNYLCVYPFVRSYDWYLLAEDERRQMLHDHGLAARPFADVRANTVAAFALGDYEWLLAFEADELHRISDLMRELRKTQARHHVREEIPFFTGRRVPLAELIAGLP